MAYLLTHCCHSIGSRRVNACQNDWISYADAAGVAVAVVVAVDVDDDGDGGDVDAFHPFDGVVPYVCPFSLDHLVDMNVFADYFHLVYPKHRY